MIRYFQLILIVVSGLVAADVVRAQNLVDSEQPFLPGVWAGKAIWGDYDNDGDLDLALIGETAEECQRIAQILRNDEDVFFEDATQTQQLVGAYYGDLAWGDYDNDGDLDLVIVGWNVQDEESLNLYRNDEGGQPTDRVLGLDRSQTAFKGVRYATVDWGDYDNDGDLDLIVSGMEENGTSLTQLYRNGGARGWLLELDEVNSEALVNVHGGDLAWGDYDGDGDLDLLVSGENVTTSGGLGPVTEFYLNSPTGTLNLDETLAAANLLKGGAAAWGDYDGDGNIDLAVSGRIGVWTPSVDLYRNRPAGVLTQDESFTLSATRQIDGQLAWVDYDNDGDADLAAVGSSRFSDYQALVFDNREGSLSSVSAEDGLQGLAGGSAAWGDYDGDGKVDLLLIGVDESGQRHGILYNNQGIPNVNNQPAAPAQLNSARVTSNNVTFSWVPATDQETETPTYNIRVGTEEGGNDILSGQIAAGPGNAAFKTSKVLQRALAPDTYHWNVQTVDGTLARSEWSQEGRLEIQQFVSSDQRLRAFKRTEMAWGDVDDDGDFDLAVMGENRSGEAQTLFYENAGGLLVVDTEAEIVGLLNGALAWGDYDNDGDLDLAISGEDERGNRASRLYRTDLGVASRAFILVGSFTDVSSSALDWGDVDNDGDLDLVLMGLSDDSISGILQSYTRLFLNDGQSGFVQSAVEPVGVNNGEAVWGDYDNDGDLDLALTGSDSQGERNLSIYANDGSGQLADADLGLEPLESSDIAWGDYDRDGDLDLAAGGISSTDVSTVVYQNNDGQMEALAGAELPGIRGGDLVWADYDNDQDLDLAITGNDGQQPFLQLYENVDASFQQDPILILKGVDFSTVALVDIDGDADLDLVSAGSDSTFAPLTVVNDNLEAQFNPNRAPDMPPTPTAQDSAATVTLSWGASADDGAPPPESLTYNLRLGTSSGGGDVVSGNAPLGLGNIGHRRFHRLGGLASGTYFWSVQAIDQGFARSDWTASAQFTIDTVAPQVAAFNVNRQQAGIGQTVILSINFADEHSGVNAEVAPVVEATIGGQTLPFELLQFSGQSWSGELAIAADTPSGTASVAVRGLVDGKNNIMVPFDSVAVFLVDTEIPQIIASEPVMEAVDVASGTAELSITFSEPIAAVTSDDFTLRLGNTELGHLTDPVYDEDSRTVRLFPEGVLLPGARYTVEVSAAVQDLVGNRPNNAITWTFSTQVPQLVQTTPTIGATEVAIEDGRLSVVFDAPIWTAVLSFEEAVQVVSEGVVQALRDAPQFDADSNTLNFELNAGLRPGSRYEVTLSNLLAGPLRAQEGEGDFRWEFQTVIPQLVRRSPEGSGVTDEEIEAEFSAALDASLVSTETVQVTRDGSAETLDAGSLVFDAQTNVLSFELEQGLKPGARYEVLLSGLLAGPLRAVGEGNFRWEFQTPVPQLDSTVPTAGGAEIGTADATLIAVFDNPIDATLLTADNVQVLQSGESVAIAAIEYNDESRTARFAVQDGLRAGTNYQVVIAGAVGGALRQGDYSWTFITAIPRLVEVTPDSGAVAVAIDLPEATVQFSTEIDADQVVVGNFVLLRDGEAVILRDGDPVNRGGGLYSLAPAAGWQVGSTYAVQVSPSVTGPLGTSQAISWQFRTAVPATVELNPASGDTQVSTANATIDVVFDHPIDETALRQAGNVRVLRSGEEVELTDPVYDAGTGTASFTIEEGLEVGTGYQVGLSSALGGPLRQNDYNWSFSTAVPQLEGVTPVDGSSGVGIGLTEAVVNFSVAIDTDQVAADNFVLLQDGLAVTLRANDPEDRGDGQYGLAPATGWQVGSTYTVQISPSVTGPLGTDQPISWKFSTAVPEAVEFTPAIRDSAVTPSDATVSIVFDNTIDAAALRTAGNVQLLEEGRRLELSDPAYNPDDNTVTFAPVGGLRAGTGYQVLLSSALGGPLRQSDYSWSFSTAVPQLEAVTPVDGSSGVDIGLTEAVVNFNVAIDADQVAADNFILLQDGLAVTLRDNDPEDRGDGQYGLAPAAGWQVGSTYTVQISPIVTGPLGTDQPISWKFSTAVPEAVEFTPAAGNVAVASSAATVSIVFDNAIDEAALRAAGNVQLLEEGRALELSDPAYNSDDNTVTFAPVGGLRAGTGYQVLLSSALGGPLQQSDYSWSFSTLVPTVVSTAPAADASLSSGPQRIQVVFSGPVDGDLITPQNFRLSSGGETVELAAAEFTYDAASFTVSYPIDLLAGSAYEAIVSSRVSGPLGSHLPDLQWAFATQIPQMVSLSPAAGDTTVSTAVATVRIAFDSAIDEVALRTAGNVQLLEEGRALGLSDPAYDSDDNTVTFAPVGGLRAGTGYQVLLSSALGGPLRQSDYGWSFSTLVPTVVSTAPAADASLSSGPQRIQVVFSGPVDGDLITPQNFRLSSSGETVELAADEFNYDAASFTVSYPSIGLLAGSAYEAIVSSRVSGPLGADLPDLQWAFSTQIPQVVSLSPAAGDTTVPTAEATVRIAFDSVIDEVALRTAGNVQLLQEGRVLELGEGDPAYNPDDNTVTFAPVGGLRAGTGYQVFVASALGGPLQQSDYSWAFSTLVPRVVNTTPTADAAISSGPQRIQVVFSSAVDEDLRTPQNFRLSRSGETVELAADEFTYDAASFTVSYPSINLLSGSAYEAIVSSRISGPLGADLPDLQWSFTTEVPQVVSTLPADGEDGVSTSSPTIQITFSQPVASESAELFRILARDLTPRPASAAADGPLPPVALAVTGFGADSSGTVISFAPVGGLRPFFEYEIIVDEDVLGDLADKGHSFTFRTAGELANINEGGTLSDPDGKVELYFPPNALSEGGEVRIRRVSIDTGTGKRAAQEDLTPIGLGYEIDAGGATLRKPATLVMRYSAEELGDSDSGRLGVFSLVDEVWQRVGGTVGTEEMEVRTAVEEFGTYALFEDRSTLVGDLAVGGLDCQPRSFDPSGGGIKSETDISFTLSGPTDVTVRVYNASGRLERVIVRDQPMAPGRVALQWDGRDEDQGVVASGLYIVVVNAGGSQQDKVVAVVR